MSRMADSVQTAFDGDTANVQSIFQKHLIISISDRFELDGIEFELSTEHLFSITSPMGACKRWTDTDKHSE